MKILRQSTFAVVGALVGLIFPILPLGALELMGVPHNIVQWAGLISLPGLFLGGFLGGQLARKTER